MSTDDLMCELDAYDAVLVARAALVRGAVRATLMGAMTRRWAERLFAHSLDILGDTLLPESLR